MIFSCIQIGNDIPDVFIVFALVSIAFFAAWDSNQVTWLWIGEKALRGHMVSGRGFSLATVNAHFFHVTNP